MDTTEEAWDRVMAVDLKSMLLATKAAVPALERRGASAAVYLAMPEARWVTGQTLVVDGGLTLTTR
jgi:NAD(P)-dependent dehydrogenase (short-subunit alcohol dehydrogenase family)